MSGERGAARLEALRGMPFTKMSGSGNDFVIFDGRVVPCTLVEDPEVIRAICNRHNGIGADGLVVLEPEAAVATETGTGSIRLRYFNSDGSPADLCGNATLCSTALAVHLGLASASGMTLLTGAGPVASRFPEPATARPEISLRPVAGIQETVPIEAGPGEERIGFALAGVPHVVVLCADADAIDLDGRGGSIRWHPAIGSAGANVNWVSPRAEGGWRYRTFERGVEGETLACGTGAVATAALLIRWGAPADSVVRLRTSSGRDLEVRFLANPVDPTQPVPVLAGEGRIVFTGHVATL